MELHIRLQHYITATDTNVSRLSKELGISQSGLSRVIKGDSMPSYRVLDALSRAGINLNWLMRGEGPMLRRVVKQGTTLDQLDHLQRRIEMLESQLADKERIIKLYERLKE